MLDDLRSLVIEIRVDASKEKSQNIDLIIITEQAMREIRLEKEKECPSMKGFFKYFTLTMFEKITCEVVEDYWTATRIALDYIEEGKAVMLVE